MRNCPPRSRPGVADTSALQTGSNTSADTQYLIGHVGMSASAPYSETIVVPIKWRLGTSFLLLE